MIILILIYLFIGLPIASITITYGIRQQDLLAFIMGVILLLYTITAIQSNLD